MGFEFDVSPGSGNPIFKQIADQVRLAVATGRLKPGEQLPSVRALAERLVVNPNTIAKAYGELSREGIIDGQQGRGVFITPPRQIYTKTERLRRISPLVDALINEGLSLGFSSNELVESLQQKLAKLTPGGGRKTL
ncbi:MAG: GntR family transcriptional regulator [Tepidisphaeraceae bacterium]